VGFRNSLIDGTGKRVLPIHNRNALVGSIPTEVGQCSQLKSLILTGNQLTGSWDFVIVLIDGKQVYQLMEMRW